MGYTNYWSVKEEVKEFEPGFIKKAKEIIKESGIAIVGSHGKANTKPILTSTLICFNGLEDDSYETFYINLNYGIKGHDGFGFCKTARCNYDVVVKAILMLLERYNYLDEWSFDGEKDETEELYVEGKKLYDKCCPVENEKFLQDV